MHDAGKLREMFNEKRAAELEDWRANGADRAVEILGRGLDELRAAGIDVELELGASSGRRSYDMVHAIGSNGTAYVNAAGTLKIDNQSYLLAIGSPNVPSTTDAEGNTHRESKADTARLYMSQYDIAQQGGVKDIRTEVYNIVADPKAVRDFQEVVVKHAARTAVLEEIDKNRSVTRRERGKSVKTKGRDIRIG